MSSSEFAPSELPSSAAGTVVGNEPASGYPPYAPYESTPAPPSVAETISAGHTLRVQHKAGPKKLAKAPPKPAKPKTPKVTDIRMPKRALRAHARCLRRHGAVLTDRLEHMSKPKRSHVICFWRQHADMLPAETIGRLRRMLDADEPFKPDQAYEYFINLRKSKKRNADKVRVNQVKKDLMALCGDRRFVWARNATVAFARGIQQRLSRPGRYVLADGMLRLSDIILGEICCYMHTRPPSRLCPHPKSKFMLEMADKIAVWIDEILSESDEHMLMMDFDEDDEVEKSIKLKEEGSTGPANTPVTTVSPAATTPGESSMPTTATETPGPASPAPSQTQAGTGTPVAGDTPRSNTPTGPPAGPPAGPPPS